MCIYIYIYIYIQLSLSLYIYIYMYIYIYIFFFIARGPDLLALPLGGRPGRRLRHGGPPTCVHYSVFYELWPSDNVNMVDAIMIHHNNYLFSVVYSQHILRLVSVHQVLYNILFLRSSHSRLGHITLHFSNEVILSWGIYHRISQSEPVSGGAQP